MRHDMVTRALDELLRHARPAESRGAVLEDIAWRNAVAALRLAQTGRRRDAMHLPHVDAAKPWAVVQQVVDEFGPVSMQILSTHPDRASAQTVLACLDGVL